ncbi:hypothetical protein ACE14D_26180 [Streptomyces sp. Act-28]
MRRHTVNAPTARKVPFHELNVHGRQLVLGCTGYRWAADPLALEFVDGRIVACGTQFDLTNIDSQIAALGIHPMSMVTRANGAWRGDGAHLFEGGPPVVWDPLPGPDLRPHQVCVEITEDVQKDIRRCELEHARDFMTAWTLTVGLLVHNLPTNGYARVEDALSALVEKLQGAGLSYLVPPDSRTAPRTWVQHLKTRATQLADMSTCRDTNGSHTPLRYNARFDHGDGHHRIVLTPVMRPAGPSTAVIDIGSLPR